MQKCQLKVVYIPTANLKPSEYNPRKWSKEAVDTLKESVMRFGLVDPVVVNGA